MIYAYIRVSTDKQNVDNQRFEIENFAQLHGWRIDFWYEETVSGMRKKSTGQFGVLAKKLCQGDVLIVSELSRLGRNLMEVMSILHDCMELKIKVLTVKERYELGDNINSKILAFAFSLSAEIERQLISQRTKEALARKRLEGVVLGRPKGSKSSFYKLTGRESELKAYIQANVSFSEMARILNVHRLTISKFCKANDLF